MSPVAPRACQPQTPPGLGGMNLTNDLDRSTPTDGVGKEREERVDIHTQQRQQRMFKGLNTTQCSIAGPCRRTAPAPF